MLYTEPLFTERVVHSYVHGLPSLHSAVRSLSCVDSAIAKSLSVTEFLHTHTHTACIRSERSNRFAIFGQSKRERSDDADMCQVRASWRRTLVESVGGRSSRWRMLRIAKRRKGLAEFALSELQTHTRNLLDFSTRLSTGLSIRLKPYT